MRPLRHGYTNHTVGDGTVVVKTYAGPDAGLRRGREHDLLTYLQDRLPVPPVLGLEDGTLRLGFVTGAPGQELLDSGHQGEVLAACGAMLRRIHDLPVPMFPGPGPGSGSGVLVHGDYGPNNLLLDPETFAVTAVVDWEFAHRGEPVEDLAWCEWIVRMHHPQHHDQLGRFFDAYDGPVPAWPVRQATMVNRCRDLEAFCRRWDPDGGGVRQWQDRAVATAGWTE